MPNNLTEMIKPTMRWIAAVTTTALVVLSLLPLRPQATLHGRSGHAVLHLAGFGVVAMLCLFQAATRTQRLLVVVSLCFLALAIEAGQCMIFGQYMEWSDVVLDCLGAAAAYCIRSVATQIGDGRVRWNS